MHLKNTGHPLATSTMLSTERDKQEKQSSLKQLKNKTVYELKKIFREEKNLELHHKHF